MKAKSLNSIPLPFFNALEKRELFTNSLFTRPDSLSALLPYDGFIENEGLFTLKDGSLGAIYSMELYEHETMTSKQIIKAVDSLKPIFNLPENCTLQFLHQQNLVSSLDNQIKDLESNTNNGHPVSQLLYKEKMDTLKDSCKEHSDNSPYKRKLLMSIRYFPALTKTKNVKDILKKGEITLYRELKEFISEMRTFKNILKTIETASEQKLTKLDANELLNTLRSFFNPKTFYKRNFASYNKNFSLSEQFLYNSPTLDFDGIEREGVKTRTLSLKTSPSHAYPGGMAYFLSLNFPYKFSLNVSFPSKSKTKFFFETKEFFLEHGATAKARRQKEELEEVQTRLARNDKCLQLTFNIILEGKSEEELDTQTQQICNIFHNKLEAEVIIEDDIGLGLALNSLPLVYTADSDYSTRRSIKILRNDIINFIPIFDSFRGLDNPLSVFLSRENNLVPFSLLENETSNHTVVLADSGSGKSAFVIECIQAAKRLSPEPLVFIIDKKSSYSMLSEYYDGDLTIFDRDKDIPFSPFRGVYDEEKISFLTNLISSAVNLASPSFNLESEHKTVITKALKVAYKKKSERNGLVYIDGDLKKMETSNQVTLTMDDFIIELGSLSDENGMREIVEPLIMKLKPFYGDGTYAKFFKGSESSSNLSKKFFIYDLDALDGDPTLQTLMTMSVIEEIRRILSLPENLGRTGFLIMEEFAMLGRNNPAFKDFAIDFAETMRKRGCWLMTLTPRPQNYFDLEVGKAFWGVASNFVFLQMNPDNCDYIGEKSSLLDEASLEIVKSLKTIKGKYAEVFYANKNKTKQGAFRYRQTSLDRWMSPTNAKDTQRALHALEKYEDKWKALDYLVKKYPNE